MSGFERYTDIALLLAKAVQGELDAGEEERLLAWRKSGEGREALYRRVVADAGRGGGVLGWRRRGGGKRGGKGGEGRGEGAEEGAEKGAEKEKGAGFWGERGGKGEVGKGVEAGLVAGGEEGVERGVEERVEGGEGLEWVEEAFGRVMGRCAARRRGRRLRRAVAVAASVVVLGGVGLLWQVREAGQEEGVVAGVEEVIVPGCAKAELVLAGGERVWLGEGAVDSLGEQKGVRVRSTGSRVGYVDGGGVEGEEEVVYNVLRVPRGGEYAVELADGSRVYLNSGSELRYPVRFVGEERRVSLAGEGYFEVARDEEHPFVVEVGQAAVEVLGTVFNVCAYGEGERVETTLVEGAVRMAAEGRSVLLVPGEQGVADGQGGLEKVAVDVYPYVAWRQGKFVFRRQTLEEVMGTVARWYDVEVVFEAEEARGISFTGNMRRYDDFSRVLELLELTGGLRFRVEERTIYIAVK